MTYAEAVTITERLRERGNASFSPSEKDEIRKLYEITLGKKFRATTCQQCYHDAVIEIALYLRKNDELMETIRPKNYELRNGFIIHATEFHNGAIFTNANLTDEIAAEYLEKYPNKARFFSRIPEKPVLKPSDAPKAVEVSSLSSAPKKTRKTKKAKK